MYKNSSSGKRFNTEALMTASVNISCRIVESFGKKDDCVLINYRKIPSTCKLATSVNNAMKPSLLVGKTPKQDSPSITKCIQYIPMPVFLSSDMK